MRAKWRNGGFLIDFLGFLPVETRNSCLSEAASGTTLMVLVWFTGPLDTNALTSGKHWFSLITSTGIIRRLFCSGIGNYCGISRSVLLNGRILIGFHCTFRGNNKFQSNKWRTMRREFPLIAKMFKTVNPIVSPFSRFKNILIWKVQKDHVSK